MPQEVEHSATRFALSIETGEVRHEEYAGVEHVVVPAVAIVEGLLWAVNVPEPEYASPQAFSKHINAWNGRPLQTCLLYTSPSPRD